MNGRIKCILKGEKTQVGLESTVVDCTGTEPVVLRSGAVTLEELRSVHPDIVVAPRDTDLLGRSPGTKYKHYAPSARVFLVQCTGDLPDSGGDAFIGMHKPENPERFVEMRICPTVACYAGELFHFFRQCDDHGIRNIYCEVVEPVGLGLALMDRLHRAAEND